LGPQRPYVARKQIMFRIFRLSFILLLFVAGVMASLASAEGPHITVLRVKGAINPVTASYIQRGIGSAEASGALAVIIQVDTPGGLDSAMRDIIQRFQASTVPVVVYVSPAGARAASAGTFITMAAHVAAMAPNTAIGAAHPVGGGGEEISGTMQEKVTNDAVAYIKGIANQRKRNADWAEKAVRESVSATEEEALKLGVIDLVAPDLPSLVASLDGRAVSLPAGSKTLSTTGAAIQSVGMNWMEDFLFAITDPNIAYILLSLALTGLFLELSNPGAILPGIVGGIALLLALFALGMLQANFAGVLLIFFAFILFLVELWVASHGMLTIGGIISLIVGSTILFSGVPGLELSFWVEASVVIAISSFFSFVVGAVVRAQRRRATTGREGLIGKTAVARSALEPEGMVFVEGERWEAIVDDGRVEPGEEVIVRSIDGLKLRVARLKS